MEACRALGTFLTVLTTSLPHGTNILPCKWVCKVKRDKDGIVTQRKMRLTPKGFPQVHGVDYFEVFARTGMYKTMRLGLALIALWGYRTSQFDVPSAFLNAEVEEEIYMAPPPGYRRREWCTSYSNRSMD